MFYQSKARLKYFISLMLFFIATAATAQTTIEYRFDAILESGKVYMNIVIRAGSICQGIYISRSTDSLMFTEIGNIPGICGNSNSDVVYTFTDIAPVPNATNYYRLRFGENGVSHVVPVLFIQLADNYKVVPNPTTDLTTIYFDNPDNQPYQFRLTDIKGNLVLQLEDIKDNQLSFNAQNLPAGVYGLSLRNKDARIISGKVVIIR